MSGLTDEQLARAKKAFQSRDVNNDGKLTVEEFSEALKPFLSDESLAALLKEVNPNGDDEITWEEFLEDYKNDL
ncbi:EF-hand domain-containing protein [Pseudomonas sp. NPDC089406]|uniref:EF-hand domain-containing protein n=1 Tax=Pseudomonas sp. NPDC089406 TaxID=3364463 RepID=UPI00384C30D1